MSRTFRRVGLCFVLRGSYFTGIMAGIGDFYHRRKRWEFYPQLPFAEAQTLFHRRLLDGVIVEIGSPDWLAWLKKTRIPAVEISVSGQTAVARVGVDDVEVGRAAARYFWEHGYRHLGYCGLENVLFSQARGRGFVREADRVGATVLTAEIPFHLLSISNQVFWLEKWVKTLPRPMGILTCNDLLGMILLQACQLARIRVPEDLAVLGVDNNVYQCRFSNPPLSSMDVFPERIGFEASALLARLMAGKPAPDGPILFPPGPIITRRSSDLVAIEDEVVREALQFIRTRNGQMIGVKEVVAKVLVSRRLLERRFRRLLGRSIRQEIQRCTIERAKELLAFTSLSLSDVARQCGYPLLRHFSTMFQKQTKTTPSAFHRQLFKPRSG